MGFLFLGEALCLGTLGYNMVTQVHFWQPEHISGQI
jgi:hypothetical protein